jgi:hypothetical protein
MSHLTYAAAADAVRPDLRIASQSRSPARPARRCSAGSALRGVLSGMAFLLTRVPVYAGALLLAAAACITGLVLFAAQAILARVLRADAAGPVGLAGGRRV